MKKTGSIEIGKEEIIKKGSGSSVELSDGLYNASFVGFLVSKKEPFNDNEDPFSAVRFALQLVDDNGNSKIVQTNDWRISLSEKSTLFKQLSGWVKSASPEDLWSRLENSGFMNENTGKLMLRKFLGVKVALITKMVASKKDATKMYPDFTFASSKKGQGHEIDLGEYPTNGKEIPIWIPDYIKEEDIVSCDAIDGFDWKYYEKREDEDKSKPALDRQAIRENLKATVPAKTSEAPKTEPTAQAEPEPEQAQAQIAPAPKPAMASQRLTIRKRPMPAQAAQTIDENPDTPF